MYYAQPNLGFTTYIINLSLEGEYSWVGARYGVGALIHAPGGVSSGIAASLN